MNKLRKIAAGFLSSGGMGKPQECLLPFKVLPCHMAAKRQGKMCKLFTDGSLVNHDCCAVGDVVVNEPNIVIIHSYAS